MSNVPLEYVYGSLFTCLVHLAGIIAMQWSRVVHGQVDEIYTLFDSSRRLVCLPL